MEIKKHMEIKTAEDEAAFCVTLQGILDRHKNVGMSCVFHPCENIVLGCHKDGVCRVVRAWQCPPWLKGSWN
jgi:hypothetical protein